MEMWQWLDRDRRHQWQTGFRHCLTLCMVNIVFIFTAIVHANDDINSGLSDKSLIEAQAFSQVRGRLGVNQAAGELNTQTNSHAIGHSASVQVTILPTSELQNQLSTLSNSPRLTHSKIDSLSFANVEGLLSVNQVSGQGNAQANLGVIALNPSAQVMTDAQMLEVNSALPLPQANVASLTSITDIGRDSLFQARGMVQINQISGSNNAAVNQFSLQFSSGD
ncbi:MAG: hypothetical protein ACRCVV_12610 [Shewanella sp.]